MLAHKGHSGMWHIMITWSPECHRLSVLNRYSTRDLLLGRLINESLINEFPEREFMNFMKALLFADYNNYTYCEALQLAILTTIIFFLQNQIKNLTALEALLSYATCLKFSSQNSDTHSFFNRTAVYCDFP